MKSLDRKKIGVSACLLGETVRYDGTAKHNPVVTEVICSQFECIPICPEMAIGLGCPRPPVQLVRTAGGVRALGRDDPSVDITDRLLEYSQKSAADPLSGYILKSCSPSCGIGSTPLFDDKDQSIGLTNGLFADALLRFGNNIPVIEEIDLEDEAILNAFARNILSK